MKRHTSLLASFFASLCLLQSSYAAVPDVISYQGRALTATGALMGAGTPVNHTVTFRIWDHPSNSLVGNLIYSEQQMVTIAEGEFSVLVGAGAATAGTPLGYSETLKGKSAVPPVTISDAFGGATRYLGVTIDGPAAVDNEISPRQQIVSGAFALRAKVAEEVDNLAIKTGMLANNAVTTTQVNDAAITTSKLAANAVTTTQIADATITTSKLAANAVTTTQIADATITSAKLATGAVTSTAILDGTITGADLGANTVTTPETLRVVRGSINANGTIATGSGFTVTKGGLGWYKITFTTPFTGDPAVTVALAGRNSVYSHIGSDLLWNNGITPNFNAGSQSFASPTGFIVLLCENLQVQAYDLRWQFIAVGPR